MLAGYLVYQAAREDSKHVRVETRPLLDQISHQSGGYILPVEVHNPGRRTLVDFTAEITYRGADGNQQRQEIKIDYLAGRARETRYLYFDADPRTLEVNARPLHYALD